MAEKKPKNCFACAFSSMEPDDERLICGHPKAGPFGKYLSFDAKPIAECGVDRVFFEQHSSRTPDGKLKP
jgi:hypothetical protein